MPLDTSMISFFDILVGMEPPSRRPKATAKKGEWPKASRRTFHGCLVETHQDDWEPTFVLAAL